MICMNVLPDKKQLISYCGICCSLCPVYRAKTCPGCFKLIKCQIRKCAKGRKIKCCFLCNKFPCKLFEEGFDWNLDEIPALKEFRLGIVKWKPYSKEYVDLFKEKDIQPFIRKQSGEKKKHNKK